MISDDILSSEENPKVEPFPTSSLATLFEKEKSNSTSSNSKDVSLAYKAPKQPKSLFNQDSSPRKKATNTIVFCAKTIKLAKSASAPTFDGENRLGLALIGNENLHAYELILYKDKQNVIYRIKVNSAFIFNIDHNKSASFNDESDDLLRIEFQSEGDFQELTQWIKKKGGQIMENVENEIKERTKSSESMLINEEIKISSNSLANVENSASTNVAEIVIPERKMISNLRSRLNAEPFNYLRSPNRTESAQSRTQHNLLPLSHNSAPLPYHDINYGTIAHSNTFMAENLNSFMAESRSQSCEMRMHMLQLSSKLDTLLRDVADVKDISKTRNIIKEHSGRSSDSLQQTVNNLKEENDDLRKRLDDKESNMEALEEQHCRLKCELQNKSADFHNKLATIENLSVELSGIKVKCQEIDTVNIERCNSSKNQIDDLSETVRMQQLKIDELQQSEMEMVARKRQSDVNVDACVKESMNKLYRNILNAFDDATTYDVRHIEQSIAGNLRSVSYELVQNVRNATELKDSVKIREKL